MFGYVNIYKDELKVREYNTFRAYYCGVCRATGRQCSNAARLGLSYDMTFLALVLSSVSPEQPQLETNPCVAHPLHKRASVIGDRAVDYAACMGVLLAYLKLYDDWKDEKSVKALFGMLLYHHAVVLARKKYGSMYKNIRKLLSELSALEAQTCDEPDRVADCFARILELLFTPDFITDEATSRSLAWLGYNTGRWIYLIDAFSDLEQDKKTKSYNPFLARGEKSKKELATRLEPSLTYTLNSIVSGYELLQIYKNDGILKNILYLGLKTKQDKILNSNEEEVDESIPGTRCAGGRRRGND